MQTTILKTAFMRRFSLESLLIKLHYLGDDLLFPPKANIIGAEGLNC